jgi:hypothetical protein
MLKRKQRLLWGALGIVLMMTAAGAAQNTDPDLGNVNDMLNGRWAIDPVDDLVAADPVQTTNPDQFTANNSRFYSDNNQITSYTNPPQNIVTVNCSYSSPWPQQTRIGRMFALPNDVIITITPGADNCKILRVQVTDPGSGASTQLGIQGSSTNSNG